MKYISKNKQNIYYLIFTTKIKTFIKTKKIHFYAVLEEYY